MKNLGDTAAKLNDSLAKLRRYLPWLFALLLLGMYGFVLYRLQVLNSAEPDPGTVQSQSQTAKVPHIDQNVLNQLQSLQDNSSNVQALIDQARDNPFQE